MDNIIAEHSGNPRRPAKPVLITYATREGQARRIAEHLEHVMTERKCPHALCDLAALAREQLFFDDYSGVIIVASVHNRKHEPEAVSFVQRNCKELSKMPCLVLSVSSAQILAESTRAPSWLRGLGRAGANELIERFLRETQLRARLAYPVAGALAFTKYSAPQRYAFTLFARLARVPYDLTRNCEYTDMRSVERRLDELLMAISADESGLRMRAATSHEGAPQRQLVRTDDGNR